MLARVREQLGSRLHRQRGRHHQHERQRPHARDRHEVADGIVREPVEQMRIGPVSGVGRHEQRVAVRRTPRDQLGGNLPERARAILHDDLLAQALGQRLREHPPGGIGPAARRERHDEADGLGRPGRLGTQRQRKHRGPGGRQEDAALHLNLSPREPDAPRRAASR